jgi:hypothetical protein
MIISTRDGRFFAAMPAIPRSDAVLSSRRTLFPLAESHFESFLTAPWALGMFFAMIPIFF